MPDNAYNKDISKSGHMARAIIEREALVTLFEAEGVKKEEIEEISITERAAEAADRAQRAAIHDAEEAASKINPVLKSLSTIFADLKQRVSFLITDLTKAGDTKTISLVQNIEFGEKAIPRVEKEQKQEEVSTLTDKIGDKAVAAEEPVIEEKTSEDRDSKAQKVIAEAAIRLALYLEDHPKIFDAFIARKMSSTFKTDLAKQGKELIRLREVRMLALFQQKKATVAEHEAVTAHITARKPINPILLKLTEKSADLDALAVEHLGILSAAARKKSKQKPRKSEKK